MAVDAKDRDYERQPRIKTEESDGRRPHETEDVSDQPKQSDCRVMAPENDKVATESRLRKESTQ